MVLRELGKEEAAIRNNNFSICDRFRSNRRFFLPFTITKQHCHPELIPLKNKQILAGKRMSEGSPGLKQILINSEESLIISTKKMSIRGSPNPEKLNKGRRNPLG